MLYLIFGLIIYNIKSKNIFGKLTMHKYKKIIIYLLFFSAFINSTALAQQSEDIVKYRIDIMKAIGSHISVIAANLKGKVDIKDDILAHSRALYLTINSINIEKTFPNNTSIDEVSKTRALPEIWNQKKEFNLAMDKSVDAAKILAESADSNDKKLIIKALGALGKTCGACHKKFRKEK